MHGNMHSDCIRAQGKTKTTTKKKAFDRFTPCLPPPYPLSFIRQRLQRVECADRNIVCILPSAIIGLVQLVSHIAFSCPFLSDQ